jgi:hypothetical protein
VNGHVVETSQREETGQMLVPVQAGMNQVQITFVRTWDRTAGGWISFASLLGVGTWVMLLRRKTAESRVDRS